MASGKSPSTYIQYIVPEDGDEEAHPNLFLVKKAVGELKVGDVMSSFPLPGTYFFRFKQSYGKGSVWLDLNEPSAKVPLFSGKVVMKVSRLSFDASSAPQPAAAAQTSSSPLASQPSPTAQAPSPVAQAPTPAPAPAPASSSDLDMLNMGGSSPAPAPAPAPAVAGGGDDFWDM